MLRRLQKPLFALYYPYCSFLNRIFPSITLDGKKLRVLPGICKPLDNEQRVTEFFEPGKRVLDVGCGSGVLTVFAAPVSEHVTAIDISPQAIRNTEMNCEIHGIDNVTIKQSDVYDAVDGQFDYIICYPPLFDVDFASDDRQWCTSTGFVDKLFRGAREHLAPGGKLVVLLPAAFRKSPETLGEQFGLELESATPFSGRPLSVRIHSIPYLYINMNNHIFTFRCA
jgi:SAM-dependent methyltransferase